MWDNTEPKDQDDSAGFAGLMIEHAQMMAWLCLFSFVGFAAWVLV